MLRWRLYIEEYSPDIRYIKGEKNVVADALSRIDMLELSDVQLLESYDHALELMMKEEANELYQAHPVSYFHIDKVQQQDTSIKKHLKDGKYHLKEFHGEERLGILFVTKTK